MSIQRGEVLGLVGESGSGKSTFGRSLLRLTPITDGHVSFDGTDVGGLDRNALKSLRRRMQMIFQDPYASLNPRMTVYDTLAEPLLLHKIVDRTGLDAAIRELMDNVGLAREDLPRNTHTNSQVVNDSALPSAEHWQPNPSSLLQTSRSRPSMSLFRHRSSTC